MSRSILRAFERVPDDHLAKFGYDHPAFAANGPDAGKWPMDKTAASQETFAEIVNPNNLQWKELVQSWMHVPEDPRACVTTDYTNFSDESLQVL